MAEKGWENNQVELAGRLAVPFTFSHQIYGEGFYMTELSVRRLSGSLDRIPIMVSDRLVDVSRHKEGEFVYVFGQFRSYNLHEEQHSRLILSVFVREIEFLSKDEEEERLDEIFLDGYLCKPPVYRKTPLGREIADLLLAVNRSYGKSDYIPCICWGRNARYATAFQVGDHVTVWGRIQSREYLKKVSGQVMERRVAYEISVNKMSYEKDTQQIKETV